MATARTALSRLLATVLGLPIVAAAGWWAFGMLRDLPLCWPSPLYWLAVLPLASLAVLAGAGLGSLWGGRGWGLCALFYAAAVGIVAGALSSPQEGAVPLLLSRHPEGFVVFVVAALALAVWCHRLSGERPWRWTGFLVALGLLTASAGWAFGHVQAAIDGELRRANEASEAGRTEEAVAVWESVVARYPGSSAWVAALYNHGLECRRANRPAEAVPYFEKILAGGIDASGRADPSRPSQSLKHLAALQLMACHEELGDLQAALRYARLARDVYPFRPEGRRERLEGDRWLAERIERLERGEPAAPRP